jgi:lycopene cyclase-like protein
VVGSGPVGLALAAGLAERQPRLRCLSRAPDARWIPNYGGWARDLDALTLRPVELHRYDRPQVRLVSGAVRELDEPYLTLNKHETRASWMSLAPTFEAGEADAEAGLVLAATGLSADQGTGRVAPGVQTAFGVEIEVDDDFALEPMRLMDWSAAFDDGGPPSFLYTLPTGPRTVFVEETVLVARPAFDIDRLEARLWQRLGRMGVRVVRRLPGTEERCWIPMGGPLPRPGGRVVPVGSAAGWVHPASGYLLGHALRWTGELAAWLSDRETVTADEAWEQIWPGPRRRAWRLYRFGMEFLLTLDQAGISEFFERFFSLPPGRTERYLSATASDAEVARTMGEFFIASPWRLRARLAAAGIDELLG